MSAGLWAFVGAALAVACEYAYRRMAADGISWWTLLWLWIPVQTFIGYVVYKLVTSPGVTLLAAFVLWSFSTIVLRIAASIALGDNVTAGTWAALGLIVTARVAQAYWR